MVCQVLLWNEVKSIHHHPSHNHHHICNYFHSFTFVSFISISLLHFTLSSAYILYVYHKYPFGCAITVEFYNRLFNHLSDSSAMGHDIFQSPHSIVLPVLFICFIHIDHHSHRLICSFITPDNYSSISNSII
jgi:hypothetical protein